MENLTIDELRLLLEWYRVMYSYTAHSYPDDYALVDKIKQAIADKEFDEKRLQF